MEMHAVSVRLGALLLFGCSDGSEATAPAGGLFQARLSGARTAVLTGASNAGSVFTEDAPGPRFAIRMYAEQEDTVRAIVIDCPGQERPAPGTYPVSAATDHCRGSYARVVSTLGTGAIVLEQAAASSGSVTITASSDGQLGGTFSFTGMLVVADSGHRRGIRDVQRDPRRVRAGRSAAWCRASDTTAGTSAG
jgi:hypothetical protein